MCPPLEYLILEDLTQGRLGPCIMDVKVGTVSYESDATPEKIAYEKQKFPLQETVGLRIQGIKVLDPATQQYEELDKHFGRQAGSLEELATAFGRYFPLATDPAKSIALLNTVRVPCYPSHTIMLNAGCSLVAL